MPWVLHLLTQAIAKGFSFKIAHRTPRLRRKRITIANPATPVVVGSGTGVMLIDTPTLLNGPCESIPCTATKLSPTTNKLESSETLNVLAPPPVSFTTSVPLIYACPLSSKKKFPDAADAGAANLKTYRNQAWFG